MMEGLLADFPDPWDVYRDNFFNQSQTYANFVGIAVVMFVFFIICAIIGNTLSKNEADRELKTKPIDPSLKEYPQIAKVRSYLPELKGKLKPIELTFEKYTKQPKQARFKLIFEPHELATPPANQSLEIRMQGRRKNQIKLGVAASVWAVFSIFLGLWGCIFSYPLIVYIYSRWRVPVIPPIEKCTESKIVPFTQQFQPLDLNDLLYGWLSFQKKSFIGLFKQIPKPTDLSYSQYVKSTFVEIEVDAEYFTISHYQAELPYNHALKQNFFTEPFPISYPTEFGDSSQEYACKDTLEKKTCSSCDGKGLVRCDECKGIGLVTCSRCDGRGYVVHHHTTYSTMHGRRTSHTTSHRVSCDCDNGQVTCENCLGAGHVTCPTCCGDGSIGFFLIRKYEFHHLSKVRTFQEIKNQLSYKVELTDIPNEDGRVVTVDNGERFIGDNPDRVPSLNQETIKVLKSARVEFENDNKKLPNLIFDQYTYREFPELAVQFHFRGKDYALRGRGFKPLQKKYFQADKFPVSWTRACLFGLPPLLWIIFSFFI